MEFDLHTVAVLQGTSTVLGAWIPVFNSTALVTTLQCQVEGEACDTIKLFDNVDPFQVPCAALRRQCVWAVDGLVTALPHCTGHTCGVAVHKLSHASATAECRPPPLCSHHQV